MKTLLLILLWNTCGAQSHNYEYSDTSGKYIISVSPSLVGCYEFVSVYKLVPCRCFDIRNDTVIVSNPFLSYNKDGKIPDKKIIASYFIYAKRNRK